MRKGLFILVFSLLQAEYNIENAFPNLSFEDPVGIYTAGDGSNRLFVVKFIMPFTFNWVIYIMGYIWL